VTLKQSHLKNSTQLARLDDYHHLWALNTDCDVLHWLALLWRTERGDPLKFKKLLQAFEFVFNVLILVLLTKGTIIDQRCINFSAVERC